MKAPAASIRRCRIESLGVSLPRRQWLKWGSVRHAVEAGRRCLEGSRYRREDVRVLINAGVHRDNHVCEPAVACYLQHRLGINIEFQGRKTLAFDLLNGACGMLNAVHVLSCLIQAGEARAGMVLSSEANSDRRPDQSYPYPRSGAAVMLDWSPRPLVGFGAFAFETRDEYAELSTSVVSLKVRRGRLTLQRRQAELEEAYLAQATLALDRVLEAEGLTRKQVDLVVPAQISAGFLARLPKATGFPIEKVANFSGELPDTHSTSVFLALHRAMEMEALGPGGGKTAVLMAFGSGVTVGAAIYRT